jgi:hypothetical protein
MAYGAYLAHMLPSVRFVEIDGADQTPFTEGADAVADYVVEFAAALAHN